MSWTSAFDSVDFLIGFFFFEFFIDYVYGKKSKVRLPPKRKYRAGTTYRLSNVGVTRPPSNDDGHRIHDLVTWNVAEKRQG